LIVLKTATGDGLVAAGKWTVAGHYFAEGHDATSAAQAYTAAGDLYARAAAPLRASALQTWAVFAQTERQTAKMYEAMSDPATRPGASEADRFAATWYREAAKNEHKALDDLKEGARLAQLAADAYTEASGDFAAGGDAAGAADANAKAADASWQVTLCDTSAKECEDRLKADETAAEREEREH